MLQDLARDLDERAERVRAAAVSPNTVPPYNRRFSGRLDELLALRERLKDDQAGNLDDIDRRRPAGQDVFGDLRVDPRPPLALAPRAGEVVGRQERQEQPRTGQTVVQPVLPIVQAVDVQLVEERSQRPPTRKPAVFGQQFLNKPTDPPAAVVRAGIGDEEIEQVAVPWHGKSLPKALVRSTADSLRHTIGTQQPPLEVFESAHHPRRSRSVVRRRIRLLPPNGRELNAAIS